MTGATIYKVNCLETAYTDDLCIEHPRASLKAYQVHFGIYDVFLDGS